MLEVVNHTQRKCNKEELHGVQKISHLYEKPLERGDVKITPFSIKGSCALENMRYIRDGLPEAVIENGEYTRLVINGQLVMSDTPLECRTNRSFIEMVNGDILIAGLGIGLLPYNLLFTEKESVVNSVTVIEKNKDLIDLLEPVFKHKKLKIINDDIFKFETKEKFNYIYFDIWPDFNSDNLEDMKLLEKKFRKNLVKNGKIDSWSKDICKRLKRRGW